MIMISIMLATIMTALDQITWVLTSYIIAAAIITPMTGWLAGRLGRKQVFVISIIGFTLASALCGAAQSLPQIVLFRVLQGVFGAAMMPLSQAVMLDTYPIEQRGPVMAIWGMGVSVAPIIGPVLGGWLTDELNWRWIFYINLPVGIACLVGVFTFIHEDKHATKRPFDIMGFSLLSVMLAAFQLFLDRGQNNDWFSSVETQIEAGVAALALILFIIHSLGFDKPFLPIGLLRDANFVTALILGLAVGLLIFSVLALLPPMTESLLGYPVVTTGLVMAPRGVGSLISIFLAGRLVGRVDTRMIIITGLLLLATAFFGMSHFSLQMDAHTIALSGFVQGLGTGLVFMPMATLAFATLDPALRADGTGVLTLVRNLGNSAGISIMQTVFTRTVQVAHSRLAEPLTQDNPIARAPYLAAPYSLNNETGMAVLNGEVTRQASMVAYVDVFHLMFIITLAAIPMVLLVRKPNDQIADLQRAVQHV